MTENQAARIEGASELERSYARALEEYLTEGGEDALRAAYEMGRTAVGEGRSLLDVAAMHHAALAGALQRRAASLERDLDRAREVLYECLSPYEMAHRGFREAITGLQHLNETLEKEIRRIANVVHDEAGQLLFAARLAVSDVARDLEPGLRERLVEIGAILDRAEKELRRLSHDLRPIILEDVGLMPALRFLADGTLRKANLSIRVESFLEERVPPNVEAIVYRVVQEALANVRRHSGAANVYIRVMRDERHVLRCCVKDDGKGFDPATVLGGAGPRGLGLTAARERLAAVGGSMEILSAPGCGTELIATIPLES